MIAENLFDSDDSLWKGMPEYKQEDQGPYFSVTIHFRNEEIQIKNICNIDHK